MAIEESDKAWLGAVLSLKGRMVLKQNKTRRPENPQVTLVVQSYELDVIARLATYTGTNPEVMKARPLKDFMRRGCVAHCPEAHVHAIEDDRVMKMNARWTVSGAAARVILLEVEKYIVVDRGWDIHLEMIRRNTTLDPHAKGTAATMNALNRLIKIGWKLPDDYREALVAQWTEQVVPSD